MPKSNIKVTRKKHSQYLELGDPAFPDKECRLVDGSTYRVIDLEQIEYIEINKKRLTVRPDLLLKSKKRNERFNITYTLHFKSGKLLSSGGSVAIPKKGQKKGDSTLHSHGSGDEGLKILKAWREYKGLDNTPDRERVLY